MDRLRGAVHLGRRGAADRRRPAPQAGRLSSTTERSAPWRDWAIQHPRGADALAAAGVQLVALPATLHLAHDRPWAWVLDVALVLPLIWRRRAPVPVFVVLAVVALGQWGFGLRLGADVALLVALYTVAATQPRRTAVAAVVVLEVGVVLAAFRFAPAGDAVKSLVFLSGLVAAAYFVGTSVRNRRAYLGALVDRAARAEQERDQQARLAATAERTRLARELHDIVAHSLTVVVTLAEAATAAAETDPPAARAAMGQVATTGRTALGEMRRLLDVLRTESGDDVSALAPAPGLDGLDGLVAGARGAGLPVRLTVAGRPRRLGAGQDATAHRIVQESLTNVLKHAVEPSAVDVLVRWEDGGLVLQISDDGRATGASGEPGHGLTGMRERVALFGGELSAGPTASGGWRVRARLPLAGESA